MIHGAKIKRILELRTGERWKVISKRKTHYSKDYALEVPVGYSAGDVSKHVDSLSASLGGRVSIVNLAGVVVVRVITRELPSMLPFDPDMLDAIQKGEILLGVDDMFQPVIHSMRVPHMLIAGMSGYGKTDLIRWILFQLINQYTPDELEIYIIDMKGFSFLPFRDIPHIKMIARDLPTAVKVLEDAVREMKRRSEIVWNDGDRKRAGGFKWRIVIVDEASQIAPNLIKEKTAKELATAGDSSCATLSSVGREAKVGLIYATQRPDANVINPQVKANMEASFGFRTKTETNSEIIIDRGGLEKLPSSIQGRIIYATNEDRVTQVVYVGNDKSWVELLKPYKEGLPHVDENTKEVEGINDDEYNPFSIDRTDRSVYDWSRFPTETSIGNSKRAREGKSRRGKTSGDREIKNMEINETGSGAYER